MFVLPDPEETLELLGDKVVSGLSVVVQGAAQDYAAYRGAHPGFVADSTIRGLANWIHDRMRARALAEFDGMPGLTFVDNEPTFELHVFSVPQTLLRFRLKKHSALGRIASYPTQTALEFISQPVDLLDASGFRLIHLCAGYEWDPDTRDMRAPVLSLRDGSFSEVIWMSDLPDAAEARIRGAVQPITHPQDFPQLPRITAPGPDAEPDQTGSSER